MAAAGLQQWIGCSRPRSRGHLPTTPTPMKRPLNFACHALCQARLRSFSTLSEFSTQSWQAVVPPSPPAWDPCPELPAFRDAKEDVLWSASASTAVSSAPSPLAMREKSYSESTQDTAASYRKAPLVRKLIFLDVDGVLHAAHDARKSFVKSCMEALKAIQAATQAEIVLSSTWRLWEQNTGRNAVDKARQLGMAPFRRLWWLFEALVKHGMPKTTGVTPDLKGTTGVGADLALSLPEGEVRRSRNTFETWASL